MPKLRRWKQETGAMAEPTHLSRDLPGQGQVYELYARDIYQSELYGFIEIEGYVFGKRTQVVVDPAEENCKTNSKALSAAIFPCTRLSASEVQKARPHPKSRAIRSPLPVPPGASQRDG